MLKHPVLTKRRLTCFCETMKDLIYSDKRSVEISSYAAPGRIRYEEALKGTFTPISIGYKFGPNWSTHWVQIKYQIPEKWKTQEIHFLWDTSSEGCVWQNGVPLQAFSPEHRKSFALSFSDIQNGQGSFFIEVAVNNLFGVIPEEDLFLGAGKNIGLLKQAELAVFNRPLWDLYHDLLIIAEMANELPVDSQRAGDAMRIGNDMVNLIDLDNPQTWSDAAHLAKQFFNQHAADSAHHLSAVGHAHIDTAWLWPVAETRRKCYRTFATAVRYMDIYPDYRFVCSQAQQLEWIKNDHPVLFEKIKEKVKTGQFIPVGGSWIEPDCNIPSCESLLRQFIYGQHFFQKEFNKTCTEFWNPDVFGYSAQIPQIIKLCGIRYFLSQKISWNQFNVFPFTSFLWEGIDGSSVLTHFPPADTYNCGATVKEVLYNVHNHKSNENCNESLLLFGFGDGGSGPTWDMLERMKRMKNTDGLPKVEMKDPQVFFQHLESHIHHPYRWVGELYLELHRGTYTTQAANKKNNRICENLLRDCEMLYAMLDPVHYPTAQLDEIWKEVLLNQFHDIIPGSSIQEVYKVSSAEYAITIKRLKELIQKALQTLANPAADGALAVNTTSFARMTVVESLSEQLTQQRAWNGKSLALIQIPALGYASVEPIQVNHPVSLTSSADSFVFENDQIRATINSNGRLSSLWDKVNTRELISEGSQGNNLTLYEDRPNAWDAWDVDAFHLEKQFAPPVAQSIRILEAGPLRAQLEIQFKISEKSTLKQIISLEAQSRRLDFICDVDWYESHKFLKTEFTWNLRSTRATYEIQSGFIERPTHSNTSWDMARFEVCAQRWADYSEPDYGVALINDCKYGYGTSGSTMRLSLLRAPQYPDPDADRGQHHFSYAIYPHSGTLQQADVVAVAEQFNNPVICLPNAILSQKHSWFSFDSHHISIQSIKKAFASDDLILRLYESHGVRGPIAIQCNFEVVSVSRCNALEVEDVPLTVKNNKIEFNIKPFEIVTFKIKRK